ncbi:hypothetical protein AYJ57_20855 (plasmid) [Salipiger sp. CCB-MM3]|uniref:hypothetical protein n=1 Tax=Salipiger sp. CCB-MM3 TaxID=1792508 RepID=UPI00080AA3A3|nr:hypothetical protein [Salipiger sp. CCB-MM3]ANT62930.1 hypothetical protein AYJ57_20855 [Salipiger sp. CCB-MM3]
MRIHTIGSAAGLLAVLALSGCILPDDYEATLALAENSAKIEYEGDLVVAPIQGEFMSGRPAAPGEYQKAVEEAVTTVTGEAGLNMTSYEYVDGGRAHVTFEAEAFDAIMRSGRTGYTPLPGIEIYSKSAEGGRIYEVRFAGADQKAVSELASIGVDVSGKVCIETELELAARSPGDWVTEETGGWFSSDNSYCVDTTLTERDEKRISFFQTGGNS